jgi:hypothetical protein
MTDNAKLCSHVRSKRGVGEEDGFYRLSKTSDGETVSFVERCVKLVDDK